jgi:hypothetical protein
MALALLLSEVVISTYRRLQYCWMFLVKGPGVSIISHKPGCDSNQHFQQCCGHNIRRDSTLSNRKKKRRLYSRPFAFAKDSRDLYTQHWPGNLTGHGYPILASLPISALENRTNQPSQHLHSSARKIPPKPSSPTSSQPPTPSPRSCSTWPYPHHGAGG